ncbi:MAG: hypothetical protein RLZZ251_290 [Actinomycetota bacterium]
MIDLRSDTVTKPSSGMRAAMAMADVGDDVYGDDPTVNSLEERVAELFGMEAALFTPTGSLANQLAIRMLVSPGEELICETTSHIARAELGAAAVFSGITTRTWPSNHGTLIASDPLAIAHPQAGPYLVSTTAIAIENTHNFGGGTFQSIDEIKKLREQSQAMGISLHLDGARIWNAHIASKVPLKDFGKCVDTMSVCLSKGLGAPMGSLMLGSKAHVASARIWRKRYGAGLRQVGIVAAAGHYALDHNIERLAIDHENAKRLAHACHNSISSSIDPTLVTTNIVALNISGASINASEFAAQAKEEGLLVGALGPHFVRLVTHMDLTVTEIEQAEEILKNLLQRAFVA